MDESRSLRGGKKGPLRCRGAFRRDDILNKLIPAIEDVLLAGGLPMPEAPPEAQPVVLLDVEKQGDVGHRG